MLDKIKMFMKVIHLNILHKMKMYFIVSIILLIVVFTLYFYYKKRKIETFTDKDSKIEYIFWTGGFDSTFRICEMLINEKKTVQPLYITFNLDNSCKGYQCRNKLWLRRNKTQEIDAMDKIRNKLFSRFPNTRNLLLPTIFIEEDVGDEYFNELFKKQFYSNNLWPKKRKVHQYYFLAKYAEYNNIYIDTGVLGIHRNSKFYRYLKKYLRFVNQNWIITDKDGPISYLRFPLFNRTKTMLYNKAKRYKYNDILKYTWSCWFPKKGKPCGKCPMCKERIINHPDNDDELLRKNVIETFDTKHRNNKKVVYLFWTGGYDSTFRLCELLLIHKKPVQTIYISDIIDDKHRDGTRRHSKNKELSSMKKIRKTLIEKYPYCKQLLLPTKHIKKINIDSDIQRKMNILFKRDMVRRPTCQYGAMAQVTRNMNKDIEVCIVKGDKLHTSITNKLICNFGKCKVQDKKIKKNINHWNKPLHIFDRFIFPLHNMTKEQLYIIAKKYSFIPILKKSWSCWYPQNNGQPCGTCIMCKGRIV